MSSVGTGPPGAGAPARRPGSDQATVRSLNRGVVLDLLKRAGPISRAEIAKRTSLTKPTVSAIVDRLIAEGLVTRVGIGAASPSGGRRPLLYDYDAGSSTLLGVHVGVESSTVSLADGTGAELDRHVRDTPPEAEAAFVGAVQAGLALAEGMPGPVTSIGIAVTGLVDHRRGTCVLAPNLGWRGIEVAALLAPLVPAPIAVHNAAQAVLAAEHLEGAARGISTAVLLYEDRGVGSSIMVDGHLIHGSRGIAGEIGHCAAPGATGRCGCGRTGCLETRLSEPAVLQRARARTGGRLRPRSLAAIARRGDAELDVLLHEVGVELGHAAALLVNIVNPEAVLVAGGFLAGGARLLDGVRAGLEEAALPESLSGVALRTSALGADGPVRGAVLLARYAADRASDPRSSLATTGGLPLGTP